MAPPVNVYYTIKDGIEDEDGDYADFIMKLRCHLARHIGKVKEDVEGHPVLAEQRTPAHPARWIYIHLAISGEDSQVILAVRDDNVYLVGFGNYDQQQEDRKRRRVWYEFGFEGASTRLLLGSTFLECDFDYPSLLGGSSYKLKRDVDLCKGKVMEAVRWLSAYKQSSRTGRRFVDDDTKRVLARLIVVVCESARMIPHFNTVNNSWRQSTYAETMLDEQQVCYLLNWANMSQALMEWKWYRENRGEDDYWPQDLTERVADVNNSDEALRVVQLLLKRKLFWRPPPPGRGRRRPRHAAIAQGHPLVEVFALRAAAADDFRVYGGTIAVFDGKRGQIIYKPLQAGAAEADAVVGGEDHAVPFVNGFVQLVARGVSVLREAIASWVLGRQHDDAPVPVQNSTGEGRDLLLTGPYRAISASGCVSIAAVNTVAAEADDDSSGDDGTPLLWDYYDDANAVYDKPLTGTIHTARGRPLEVTYAVLSDAVQATVQVYMSSLLAQDGVATTADILVHGRIVARSRAFDDDVDTDMDARCVLFSRDSDDKVAATPDNYQVPLVRSILAVPLGSPLLIEATLHASAAAAADQAGVDFIVSAEFHPEPSGNKAQRFLVVHDELRMNTTTLLMEPSTEKHKEGYIHTGYDSILVKVIWESDL
ncbi:60 kDa jasmonate-induced protein-like [Miscanthus floridulus]|uniref:60 kDa jasmonate-induced protein-like n=1 Tax=Miscanthus floridulus TaxID=154761 RepID=UPI0034577EA2